MKKILICAACVLAWFSSNALAQGRPPATDVNVTTHNRHCGDSRMEVCPSVSGVEVIAGDRELTVSWTAVPRASKYVVLISRRPNLRLRSPLTVDATTTSVTITSLTFSARDSGGRKVLRTELLINGERYYIWVESFPIEYGLGEWDVRRYSRVVSAIPGGNTPPPEPEPTPPPPPPPEPTPPEPDPEPTPPPPEPTPPEPNRHTNIYFVNTVGHSKGYAEILRALLEQRYSDEFNKDRSQSPPYPGTYSFHKAYNPANSRWFTVVDDLLADVWTETAPAVQELNGFLLRRLLKYWITRQAQGDPAAARQIRRFLSQPLRKFLKRTSKPPLTDATIDALTPRVLEALTRVVNLHRQRASIIPGDGSRLGTGADHALKYSTALRKGKRVFVVSHGEGNWLANETLEAVAQALYFCASSLEQIGVATPASKQFRPFYQTDTEDHIINRLRRRLSDVLPANVTNRPRGVRTFYFDSDRRHDFQREYMWPTHPSSHAIDKQMRLIAGRTPFPYPFPPPSCGGGPSPRMI